MVTAMEPGKGIVCWAPAVVASRSGRSALIVCMVSTAVLDPDLVLGSGGGFEASQRPSRRCGNRSGVDAPQKVVLPQAHEALVCVPASLVRPAPPESHAYRPLRGTYTTASLQVACHLGMEIDDVAFFRGAKKNGTFVAAPTDGDADELLNSGQWVDAWVDSAGVWAEGVVLLRVAVGAEASVDLTGYDEGRMGRRRRSRRTRRAVSSTSSDAAAASSAAPVPAARRVPSTKDSHGWSVFFGNQGDGRSLYTTRRIRPSARWSTRLKWWVAKRAAMERARGVAVAGAEAEGVVAGRRLPVCACCRLGPLPYRSVDDVGGGVAMHAECAQRQDAAGNTVRVHLPASMMPLQLRRRRDRFRSCLEACAEELRLRLALQRQHAHGTDVAGPSPFATRAAQYRPPTAPATPSADAALVSIALHIETSEIDARRVTRGGGKSRARAALDGGVGGKRSRGVESLDDDSARCAKKAVSSGGASGSGSSGGKGNAVRHKDDMWLSGIVVDHVLRRLAQSYPAKNVHFMPSSFVAFDLPRRLNSGAHGGTFPLDVQQAPVDLAQAVSRLKPGEDITIIVPYNIKSQHWNLIRIVIRGEGDGELQLFEPLGRPAGRGSFSGTSGSVGSGGERGASPALLGWGGGSAAAAPLPPSVSRRSLPNCVLEWLDNTCALSAAATPPSSSGRSSSSASSASSASAGVGGRHTRPWFDACVSAITTQQQRTGFDCGVASLLYAEQCAQGYSRELINRSTDQREITRFRETLFEYLRVLQESSASATK